MNVFEAAQKRISVVFDNFDNICVAFSGGKDSGVLLHLAADEARKRGRRIAMMHLDYECQYRMTTDYVAEMEHANADILDIYHVCVPFRVTTCTSMYLSWWRPWDPEKKEIWVRNIPEGAKTIADFPFYDADQWDYDFQEAFGRWLHKKSGAEKTCILIGIRTQESMNRWRAIFSDRNFRKYRGLNWTKDYGNGIVNAYPIYDFLTEDIWIANAKNRWNYNRLYDLYYMAGLNIDQMRVASPFISEGQETLKLYKVIEPDTWGRLVSRVNGVNFTGIYGGTTAMGWRSITKPEGKTWEEYMYFLLSTLPEKTKLNYLNKLQTSMQFWKEKGGCLSESTIKHLRDAGVDIDVAETTNYRTDKLPVRMDYLDDIDLSEFKEIPTFKRMCVCILKNDHLCKYMGFSQTKHEVTMRKNIIEKYKSLL